MFRGLGASFQLVGLKAGYSFGKMSPFRASNPQHFGVSRTQEM